MSTQLERLVDRLREDHRAAWVARENFHITLAFLGSVDGDKLSYLVDSEALRERPFTLTLENIEYQRRRRLIWIAPRRVPLPLERLLDALQHRLAEGNFRAEARPFRAHLTLARKVRGEWTTPSWLMPIHWTVRSYCLIESKLDPCGAHYTTLKTWSLLGTNLQDP